MARYQLHVSDRTGETPAVRIYDNALNRILLSWQGDVAREMLEKGIVPRCKRAAEQLDCDKVLIRELALKAAAISMSLHHNASDKVRSGRVRGFPLVPEIRRKPAFGFGNAEAFAGGV